MKEAKLILNNKRRFGHYSRFERRDFPFIYALIAIPVLHFIIFWGYVNFSSFAMAFQSYENTFTFDHFKTVFDAFAGKSDTLLLPMVLRSLTLWGVASFISFPISIITTYVLFRRIHGHYIFRICYIIPGLMGAVIWTTLVRFMVGNDGPVTMLVKALGIDLPENAMRNGLFGASETAFPSLVVIGFIMSIVGSNAVLTGALSRIPQEIFESSRLDGASFWREFFLISVPCIWPTIATVFTFSLCGILTADSNVFLYSQGTGEPGMATMGFHLYYLTVIISQRASSGPGVFGYPAALGMVLTAITIPIVLIARYLMERFIEPVEY